MSLDDRDALREAVRRARPTAPAGLEARVLRLALPGPRRRPTVAIAAGLLVLTAALVVVVVERASRGTTAPVAGPDGPVRRPTPAPAPAPGPPVTDASWSDVPLLLERILTPHLAALRACDETSGPHWIALRIESAPRNLRVPETPPAAAAHRRDVEMRLEMSNVSVTGHRDRTAVDRCLEDVVAGVTLPRMPDQLLDLHVVIAVPSEGEPLRLGSGPEASAWRDPVTVVQSYLYSDFSNKPSRDPMTVDRCVPRKPGGLARSERLVVVELTRDAVGVTRGRYLGSSRTQGAGAVDRCLDERIANLRFPTLPPSLRRLTVVYRPSNR